MCFVWSLPVAQLPSSGLFSSGFNHFGKSWNYFITQQQMLFFCFSHPTRMSFCCLRPTTLTEITYTLIILNVGWLWHTSFLPGIKNTHGHRILWKFDRVEGDSGRSLGTISSSLIYLWFMLQFAWMTKGLFSVVLQNWDPEVDFHLSSVIWLLSLTRSEL